MVAGGNIIIAGDALNLVVLSCLSTPECFYDSSPQTVDYMNQKMKNIDRYRRPN